jgi:Mrp family chromosome partitioning ATPase
LGGDGLSPRCAPRDSPRHPLAPVPNSRPPDKTPWTGCTSVEEPTGRERCHPHCLTKLTPATEATQIQAQELAKQAELEKQRLHGAEAEGEEEGGPRRHVHEVTFRNLDAKLVLSEELEPRHIVFSERHVGEVYCFSRKIEEKLEKLGLFREQYGFQYMRKPHSVIRPHAGLVARRLLTGSVEHMDTKYRRVIVTGEGGTGKSFILMQIAATALMKNYIVIAVPRGS